MTLIWWWFKISPSSSELEFNLGLTLNHVFSPGGHRFFALSPRTFLLFFPQFPKVLAVALLRSWAVNSNLFGGNWDKKPMPFLRLIVFFPLKRASTSSFLRKLTLRKLNPVCS